MEKFEEGFVSVCRIYEELKEVGAGIRGVLSIPYGEGIMRAFIKYVKWGENGAIYKTFAVGHPAELAPETLVRVESFSVRAGGRVACDATDELRAFVIAALDARPDFAMEGEGSVLREGAPEEELRVAAFE